MPCSENIPGGRFTLGPMAGDPPKRRGRPPAGGREAILAATLELVRERGVARLTTRDVADRAGVSEASVYYHYRDKAGLLSAVFESGLEPLRAVGDRGLSADGERAEVLTTLARPLEQFLDQALPVLMAAQSDAQLREQLAGYMAENDLGPHRRARARGASLAAEQKAGRVLADIDPEAVAFLLVAACFLRAAQRQIMGTVAEREPLPSLERTVQTLDRLLRPAPER